MSAKTVFISYRRDSSGRPFARLLEQALTHKGYDVFLDVRNIESGKWADQILTEVPKRAHFLLVITPGALDRCDDPEDWVRREFELALRSRRNIVPIREESVDLKQLQKDYADTMKGLFDLQIPTIRNDAFESDVDELMTRYIPPDKAPVEIAEPSRRTVSVDIDRIVKYAPADLIGRTDETKILNEAWDRVVRDEKPRAHILTFVALGGEGKTSLVAKWAAELAARDWPGCDSAFAWSFFSQGTREQVAASSDLFLKEALTFFGDEATAGSAKHASEKGKRLAQLVGERRALLILDGVEPLQYPPTPPHYGRLKDDGIAALLKGLAAASQGLCIVTSRYSVPDLRAFWQTTASEIKLLRLSRAAGVHLLKTLGVRGTAQELETLVEDVKGHALTLQIMGGFLKRAFGGDIRQRDRVKFEKADEKVDGGNAFRAMAAYAQWLEDGSDEGRRELAILRCLGLFERPATRDSLEALLQPPVITGLTEPLVGVAQDDWQFSLDALEGANLLALNSDSSGALLSLDTHPHIREYFAKQLREKSPNAWRAAHRRLYEHLRDTTHESDQPTLEDLQPLYQAIAHGCQAGLHAEACHEVFAERVVRRDKHFSTRILGAFGSDLGALACFYDILWSSVSPSLSVDYQAWVLSMAAYTLRALGRLADSLKPMRAALEIATKEEHWERAAARASNLSELELTLGEVAEAVADAEQSVAYADRSPGSGERMINRSTHADALHQAGRWADAETCFREVEQIQKERQPYYPLLYSLQGFRYCDLLLAVPERAAWEDINNQKAKGSRQKVQSERQKLEFVARCREVAERAAQTLKWYEQASGVSLLDWALDHLTLGRAELYAAILTNSKFEDSNSELAQAVDGLRRAGNVDELPRGLLTRAWLRFLTDTGTGPESAQQDLDEAWEIAERGPMKLHMADIHLYRARLFGGMKDEGGRVKYPWNTNPDGSPRGPKDDLDAAEKLINECGYHRRDEELADAKEAAENW